VSLLDLVLRIAKRAENGLRVAPALTPSVPYPSRRPAKAWDGTGQRDNPAAVHLNIRQRLARLVMGIARKIGDRSYAHTRSADPLEILLNLV
jgi:hypothetical protein